jgi:hypothetical protein
MILSKADILSAAKDSFSQIDSLKGARWERALMLAVDDMATRMRSRSLIRSYTQTLSANTRTVTLSGESDDLRFIWCMKLGAGDNERVLDYQDPEAFLQDYDSSTAEAGHPTKYTVLKQEDGFPVIKLESPLSESEDLLVYYWYNLTTEEVVALRSITALVLATQAFFSGLQTPEGQGLYNGYAELVKLARANELPVPRGGPKLPLPRSEVMLRRQVKAMMRR